MHILAYVDPGTGAFLWQAMVGACVGVVFYFKATRKWVGQLFTKLLRRRQNGNMTAPAGGGAVERNHS
jgi:hypothetical protein